MLVGARSSRIEFIELGINNFLPSRGFEPGISEIELEKFGPGNSVFGIAAKHSSEQIFRLDGNQGLVFREWDSFHLDFGSEFLEVLGLIWTSAEDAFVDCGGEGVDVGLVVVEFSTVDFWGHVDGGSISLFGLVALFEFLTEAEISKFDLAVVEENVSWLEISVDDAAPPDVSEGVEKLL